MKVLQLIIFAGVCSVYAQEDASEAVTTTTVDPSTTVSPTDSPTPVVDTAETATTTVESPSTAAPTDSPTPLVPPAPEAEAEAEEEEPVAPGQGLPAPTVTEEDYEYMYEYEYDSVEPLPLIDEVDECTPYGQEVSCALEAANRRCAWIPKSCREMWRPECDTFAQATKTLGTAMKVYTPEQRRMARQGMVVEIAVAMSPSKVIAFAMNHGRRMQDGGYCCGQAPDCLSLSTSECEDHTHCELSHHLTDECTMVASCYPKDFTPPMPQCHLSNTSLPDEFINSPQGGSSLNSGNCNAGYFSYGQTGNWEWTQCDSTKWYNKSTYYWPKRNGNYNVCKWKWNTSKCEIVRSNQY